MQKFVVLVDYGGVLGDDHLEPASSELARALGVDISESRAMLSERSWLGRAFRMGQLTETEFWDAICESVGYTSSSRPADAVLTKLWAQTYMLNTAVLAILKRVRQQHSTGILTNIDHARSDYLVEVVGVLKLVDFYFPTYRFGAVKPDSRLFSLVDEEIVERELNARIIYVDDRDQHVEAARLHGWSAFRFCGPIEFERDLLSAGVL